MYNLDTLRKRFENRFDKLSNNVKKITPKQRLLDQASKIADLVLKQEEKYAQMSDLQLKKISYQMMDEIVENNVNLDNFLIDGLAIAREMIYRTYNQKAYRVQLIGAIIVHFGDFAEMATGEGKTLTLLLVSYVNALSKKGVHIVTVNEYLVERDAEYSRNALSKLGITVGFIKSSMDPNAKREMYKCDITYVSNSELGFDYLRDNMVQSFDEKMQRGLNFAIVDEADSVLIDEARTPLIIAGTPNEDVSMYLDVDKFVKSLKPEDYIIDLESQAINLNDNGIKKAEAFFKLNNLYDIENSEIVHKIMNSLRANYIMQLGKEYIVRKNPKKGTNEIALVDSFTGRIMDGRMYSAGLHQAIQAKEGVDIEPENMTMATITYQSFFRMYKKLAGVSGTALTEKNELLNIYNMVVVNIPFNKPKIRKDEPDYIFATKQLKWKYVVADIKKRHALGQPVLVGTVSVEDSELLHQILNKIGIPHQVLNAKNNAQEAKIIEKAGQKGAVTIATNMAGRGTDIKLGEGVKELGGLYVIGTERNESRRIDNQLRGRSGRQGDPGESRFFISLQDSLFKRFATNYFDKAQYKLGEDIIDLKFFSKLLDRTQKKVENVNFDVRKNLIDYDYVLGEQRELFYKQRDNVLLSDNIIYIVFRMIPRIVETMINIYRDQTNPNIVDVNRILNELKNNFNIKIEANLDILKNKSANEIFNYFTYAIRYVVYQAYKKIGKDASNDQWRKIIISCMDDNWTKFLEKVQKLRDNVALRSFEQKSPLNIYVEDSDYLFFNMTVTVANQTVSAILNADGLTASIFDLDKVDNNNEIQKIVDISNSIDDLELSPIKNDNNNNHKENDKINDINKESIIMDNNNNNPMKNNIDSIVDEIFNDFNEKSDKNEVEEISFEKTSNGYKSVDSVPPPIPTSDDYTIEQPTNKPANSNNTFASNINDTDSFLNEVLNVVNNDIKPQEVQIDIDAIVNDEDKKEINKFESTQSTSANNLNNNNNQNNNSNKQPSKTPFIREDDNVIEKYNSTYKNAISDLYKSQEQTVEYILKQKELDYLKQAQKLVDEAKDEKIKQLQNQIESLYLSFNEYKLKQEENKKNILNNEQLNLKEIHELLFDTIKQQHEIEDDFNETIDLLNQQQNLLGLNDQILNQTNNNLYSNNNAYVSESNQINQNRQVYSSNQNLNNNISTNNYKNEQSTSNLNQSNLDLNNNVINQNTNNNYQNQQMNLLNQNDLNMNNAMNQQQVNNDINNSYLNNEQNQMNQNNQLYSSDQNLNNSININNYQNEQSNLDLNNNVINQNTNNNNYQNQQMNPLNQNNLNMNNAINQQQQVNNNINNSYLNDQQNQMEQLNNQDNNLDVNNYQNQQMNPLNQNNLNMNNQIQPIQNQIQNNIPNQYSNNPFQSENPTNLNQHIDNVNYDPIRLNNSQFVSKQKCTRPAYANKNINQRPVINPTMANYSNNTAMNRPNNMSPSKQSGYNSNATNYIFSVNSKSSNTPTSLSEALKAKKK